MRLALILIGFISTLVSGAEQSDDKLRSLQFIFGQYQKSCSGHTNSLSSSDCNQFRQLLRYQVGDLQNECLASKQTAQTPPSSHTEVEPQACPERARACDLQSSCTWIRDVFDFFAGLPDTPVRTKVIAHLGHEASTCLKSLSQPDCLSEATNRLVIDYLTPVDFNFHGLNTHTQIKEALSQTEDKTRLALIALSSQSSDQIEVFKKSPGEFYQTFFTQLASRINGSMQNTLGCRQWEGTPHFSKCVEPLSHWSCLSCEERTHQICSATHSLGLEMFMISDSAAVRELISPSTESALSSCDQIKDLWQGFMRMEQEGEARRHPPSF